MEQAFDLKVRDRTTGKTFTRVWDGRSEEDAARRYVDCFRDHEVFATRPHRETNILIVGRPGRIIEPGDRP